MRFNKSFSKAHIFKGVFLICLIISSISASAQTVIRVKNKFPHSNEEIVRSQEALLKSIEAIRQAYLHIENIYAISIENNKKIEDWNNDTIITSWLGKATRFGHIKKSFRRIKKLDKLSRKNFFLVFEKSKKRGLCRGTRHAWTIPKGKLKIHLCEQFIYKSSKHQSKIFIHELGHESGILFHRRVYWRESALKTADLDPKNAIRNPENFAFYIMSFYSE